MSMVFQSYPKVGLESSRLSGSLKDHIIIIEVLFTSAVNSQLKFTVQFISLKEQTGSYTGVIEIVSFYHC